MYLIENEDDFNEGNERNEKTDINVYSNYKILPLNVEFIETAK